MLNLLIQHFLVSNMLTCSTINKFHSIIINVITQGDEVMSIERTDLVKMGKRLSDLRKRKNLTQMQLADILDVSNKTVSKWEVGDIAPDITILLPLSDVLEVSIEEILTGGEQPGETKSVSIYKKMNKKRVIREIIIFILIAISLIFFVRAIENYYKWNVEELYAEGDYYVHGYLIRNNDNFKIMIDKIDILNEMSSKKSQLIKYEISIDNIIVFSKETKCEDNYVLNCISRAVAFYEESGDYTDKYDFDDITLHIQYQLDDKEKQTININLIK